ncbi:MAG: hypothetical protein LC808_00480 [Actinobacteria bacterium]|nr:hypothetical protein [Actinomycetota bacterium]
MPYGKPPADLTEAFDRKPFGGCASFIVAALVGLVPVGVLAAIGLPSMAGAILLLVLWVFFWLGIPALWLLRPDLRLFEREKHGRTQCPHCKANLFSWRRGATVCPRCHRDLPGPV